MMTPSDYRSLFETCVLTTQSQQLRELEVACHIILLNQIIYQNASGLTSIPWPLIAVLHFRESSLNFHRHLHNGDLLAGRTIHEPKNRPMHGEPPFTWIESAVDALSEVWIPASWDLASCLEFLERYNGLGYQYRKLMSPYLWSYTDKYVSGLFIADGRVDLTKIDRRPGCVALLKALAAKGVSLEFSALAGNHSLH